jgi:hypothetical protein
MDGSKTSKFENCSSRYDVRMTKAMNEWRFRGYREPKKLALSEERVVGGSRSATERFEMNPRLSAVTMPRLFMVVKARRRGRWLTLVRPE